MENLIDNPLYRLYDFLIKVREVDPGQSSLTAWKTILGATDQHMGVVHYRLFQLDELIRDSFSMANKHVFEDEHDLECGKEWFDACIRISGNPQLMGLWKTNSDHITAKVVSDLKNHARLYSKIKEVGRVKKEDIDEFRDKIAKILDEAIERQVEGMPEAIYNFIQSRLLDIIDAIDNYSIGGWIGVKRAYSTAFGEGLFNEQFRANPSWRESFDKAYAAAEPFIKTANTGQVIEWTQARITDAAEIIYNVQDVVN